MITFLYVLSGLTLYWTIGLILVAWSDTDDLQILAWVQAFPIGGMKGYLLLVHWIWPYVIYRSYKWRQPVK